MNNSFDEQMRQLKEEYDRMPDQTTPDRIWAHVKYSKPKRRIRFSWLGTTVGAIAAASLAGLLVVSQSDVSPDGEDKGAHLAPYDNREYEERHNIDDEENNNNVFEEPNTEPSEKRDSEKEISYLIEGMEETDTFKLLEETGFSFSTYIPEHFQAEVTEENEIAIYAAFTPEQEQTDTPVWTIQESSARANETMEEKAAEWEEEYEAQGYELVQKEEGKNLTFGDYAATFEGAEYSYLTVIGIENNGTTVKWEQTYPPEMGDGLAAREAVVMEEWEWKEAE
ncbi:hypothetical protein ACE1TI_05700 [Alteribacillus sp. JSM 102045]|uniref:hypothetical protein n=1 Tax=Alteribacillus sp. JSM 102045 TaxID=1562101 RepID=UPI0035C1B70A